MPPERRTHPVLRRIDVALHSPWFVVFLAVAAAIVAILSNHFVYPHYSWNRDEPVYLWQTSLLRDGHLTATDGGYPALFHPWLSAHRDGVFFSQYPLGWPLAILVGQVIGWPAFTLAFACVLAVVGTYALANEVTRDRRIAAIAGSFFLLSPIVAIQGGVYLTYMFATGLGALFATYFLAGLRLSSRWRVALGGVFLGVIIITRTYDAVVWAAVLGGYVVVTERKRWREHLRLVLPFLAGVVPFMVLQLGHNVFLTGHPAEFPITTADPLDKFGFGPRRLMPDLDSFRYTPLLGVKRSAKNAFFLPWFLFGAYVGVVAAVLAVVKFAKDRSTWLLVAICAGFPIAYFPFWGTHVSSLTTRISGPIYYIPIYVPLCVLMAQGAVYAARRWPRATAVLAVLAVLITVPIGIGRLARNRELSQMQVAWSDSTKDLKEPALVVVSPEPYLMFSNPFGRNGAEHDDPILYALATDPSLINLVEAHPERTAYVQRATVPSTDLAPSEHNARFGVELVPLTIVRGKTVDVSLTTTAGRDGAVSVAVSFGSKEVARQVVTGVKKGEAVVTHWTLGTDAKALGRHGILVPEGGSTPRFIVGYGATGPAAHAHPKLKYELLVQGGAITRALQPGTVFQAESYRKPGYPVVWHDDVPDSRLTVEVVPGS
ncbi:hypothetical protein [Aquihabitans sp. McL0605]|uniref:hypothetical protein n=1 Tax=Aquihabitans sp. McL0605 TaxID=3415671 RepID=UPI003CE6BB1F